MEKVEIRELVLKEEKEHYTSMGWNIDIVEPQYDHAIEEDGEEGMICSHCGKPNNFWDDVGWFFFPGPGCQKCWWGKPGKKWRKIYGLGER